MTRTIFQGLKDEIHYPMPEGYLINRLAYRGLDGEAEFTAEVLRSRDFGLTVADCLISLLEMPTFKEGDKEINMQYKDLLTKRANALYLKHGEPESIVRGDRPRVIIGG